MLDPAARCDQPGVNDGAHRLVERSAELDALSAQLSVVRGVGRMVFVGGEAGVGKTAPIFLAPDPIRSSPVCRWV